MPLPCLIHRFPRPRCSHLLAATPFPMAILASLCMFVFGSGLVHAQSLSAESTTGGDTTTITNSATGTETATVKGASNSSQVIDRALFLLHPGATPPADTDRHHWQAVTLPDRWPIRRYQSSDNGWYAFALNAPQAALHDGDFQAIYLPRVNMNAAVWFNGQLLGDGGTFEEPMARNWNHGLIFAIPAALWRPGLNEVRVRLKSYPGYGRLDPIIVGPWAQVYPQFSQRDFWQTHVSTGLFLVTLAIGLFILALWLRRRKDSQYLWFALAALSWSIFSLNHIVRNLPFNAWLWDVLVYSLTAWWTTALAIFSYRYTGSRHPRIEAAILIWATCSTLVYLASDIATMRPLAAWWQSGSLVTGAITLGLLLRHWYQTRRLGDLMLSVSIALVLLAGANDWLVQADLADGNTRYGTHLLPLTAPLLFIFMAWHLTGRFVTALNESEALNAELEQRVEAARQKLEDNYRHTRLLERQQAISDERERIHQDLHDDVGARILSLIYHTKDPGCADLARSALQDLRDVVTRSAQGPILLEDLIADWRGECYDRLQGQDIKLQWALPDQLPYLHLDPGHTTNLGRILREAISNILRHSEAKNINVGITHSDHSLQICVQDDGKAGDPQHWKPGSGLNNMRNRIRRLNGEIHWEIAERGGCRVCWRLTLPTDTQPDSQPAPQDQTQAEKPT